MPSLPCNLVFRVQISLIEGGDSGECAVRGKRPYGERALGLRDEVVVRACGEERASQRTRGFAGVVVGASRFVIARGSHGDRSGRALRAGIMRARAGCCGVLERCGRYPAGPCLGANPRTGLAKPNAQQRSLPVC